MASIPSDKQYTSSQVLKNRFMSKMLLLRTHFFDCPDVFMTEGTDYCRKSARVRQGRVITDEFLDDEGFEDVDNDKVE